jgi:hypothetical protein
MTSNKLLDSSEPNNFLYLCYYCKDCQTNNEADYERHVVLKHLNKPAYPCKLDLERLRIKTQGRRWEI